MKTANTAHQLEKDVSALFTLGAHLGHKKNRLHPKARKFIYQIVNGVSIIDLTKTVDKIAQAKTFLVSQGKDGKTMLIVSTKKIANQYVADLCKSNNIPYITMKWLPGLLTNFTTIMKNVKKLQTLKEQRENGDWDKFVKHERNKLDKELTKLERFYGGLITMTKKPDTLFIVDSKKEKNALKEAQSNKIPVVGVIDTNSDPDQIQYPIVVNDDSPAVLQYVIADLIQAYTKAKTV